MFLLHKTRVAIRFRAKTKLIMHTDYPKFIGMPAMRTDGQSVYGHVITKFLGWVDYLSQGALPTGARSARMELRYYNIINCKSPHDACGVMALTKAEIQSAHVTSHFMQCVEKVITIVVSLFVFLLSTALITVIDSWLPLAFATSVTLKV